MKPNELLIPAWTRLLAALGAVAIAAMLSSCAHLNPPEPKPVPEPTVVEKKPPPEPIAPPPPSSLYEWWGKNEYLSHVEVSIDEQKARFYSGDKLVGWTTVASGVRKFPTPTGSFAVTEKVQNKKSNLYGKIYNKNGKLVRRSAKMGVHKVPAGGSFRGAPMPYFLRLTNDGIGMHAGPIPRPGNRASHGCIRMPKNFAPILYRHVDVGTPVIIKGNGPTYASYVSKQRRSAPKRTKTAVAKAAPSPARTAAAVPAAATSEAGSAAPQPMAVQEAAADVAASAPSAAVEVPSSPLMTEAPASTVASETPPPIPAAPSAPAAHGMTGMGGEIPAVDTTATAPPPAVQTVPASGMTGGPASLPVDSTPVPAPAAATAVPSAPPEPTTGPAAPSATGSQSAPAKAERTPPVEAKPPSAATEPAKENSEGDANNALNQPTPARS
jgi:hypothetical protein